MGKTGTFGIAADEDIDNIISGKYEGTSGYEPGAASDADIDAIIAGAFGDVLGSGGTEEGPVER